MPRSGLRPRRRHRSGLRVNQENERPVVLLHRLRASPDRCRSFASGSPIRPDRAWSDRYRSAWREEGLTNLLFRIFQRRLSAGKAQGGVAPFALPAINRHLHTTRFGVSPQPAEQFVSVHQPNIGRFWCCPKLGHDVLSWHGRCPKFDLG